MEIWCSKTRWISSTCHWRNCLPPLTWESYTRDIFLTRGFVRNIWVIVVRTLPQTLTNLTSSPRRSVKPSWLLSERTFCLPEKRCSSPERSLSYLCEGNGRPDWGEPLNQLRDYCQYCLPSVSKNVFETLSDCLGTPQRMAKTSGQPKLRSNWMVRIWRFESGWYGKNSAREKFNGRWSQSLNPGAGIFCGLVWSGRSDGVQVSRMLVSWMQAVF